MILLLSLSLSCKKDKQKKNNVLLGRVNGVDILLEDFEEEKRMMAFVHSMESPESERIITRNILGKIVDRVLLLQEAGKRNISADPKLVEEEIKKIEKDYSENSFSAYLKQNGISYDKWKVRLAEMLVFKSLKESITGASNPPVTDEEVYIHYKTNAEKFRTDSSILLRQILVKDIEKANEVMKLLSKGEDFEKLARELSIGYEANKGGLLLFLTKNELPKELEAVFDMPIGGIFGPVKSNYGVHIIRVEKKTRGVNLDLKAAKPEIIKIIKTEKKEKEFQDWLSLLRESAQIEIYSVFDSIERVEHENKR